MKDFYIVTHQVGAGGAFLNTLIYSWLTNEDVSDFEFDEYGSAHGDIEGVAFGNHQNGSVDPVTRKHSSLIPCWSWLKAIDKTKPLCVRSHCLVDDTINDYYPNYQHFHILTTPDDYEILAFNTYIKQNRFEVWSDKDAKQHISEIVDLWIDGYNRHDPEHDHWYEPYDNPNTINILFKDMMTNPSKVHTQIADVLGPMPNYIVHYHSNYISKNKQVVKKYAPWITYYEINLE